MRLARSGSHGTFVKGVAVFACRGSTAAVATYRTKTHAASFKRPREVVHIMVLTGALSIVCASCIQAALPRAAAAAAACMRWHPHTPSVLTLLHDPLCYMCTRTWFKHSIWYAMGFSTHILTGIRMHHASNIMGLLHGVKHSTLTCLQSCAMACHAMYAHACFLAAAHCVSDQVAPTRIHGGHSLHNGILSPECCQSLPSLAVQHPLLLC